MRVRHLWLGGAGLLALALAGFGLWLLQSPTLFGLCKPLAISRAERTTQVSR